MRENDWLAVRFDETRGHLHAVAYRMLGSTSEAEDAVQETWIKLSRSDTGQVENLEAWLTTVVARVCLDMLRARGARREDPFAPIADPPSESNPENDLLLADAIGPALLIVLDTLTPAERIAFVLHDMFDLSFEEIAPIVDRTAAAARQLASRARRAVRGATTPEVNVARQREVVSAFLAASRDGDFERLVSVLAPDVVLRADDLAVRMAAANQQHGAPNVDSKIRGASRIADAFKGRAQAAQSALIDGEPGAVWAAGGQVRAAFVFTIKEDKIARIDVIMEPGHIAELNVELGGVGR